MLKKRVFSTGLLGFLLVLSVSSALANDPASDAKRKILELEDFPVELIYEIVDHLDLSSFSTLMATNKIFRTIGEQDPRWKESCLQKITAKHLDIYNYLQLSDEKIEKYDTDFQLFSNEGFQNMTWHELYIYLEKLGSNTEKSMAILEPSNSRIMPALKGLTSTLINSTMISCYAIPAGFVAGVAGQAMGIAMMSVSGLAALTSPRNAICFAGKGACVFAFATALEFSTICLVLPASVIAGYHLHNFEKIERAEILTRNFKRMVWYELIDRIGSESMFHWLENFCPY